MSYFSLIILLLIMQNDLNKNMILINFNFFDKCKYLFVNKI